MSGLKKYPYIRNKEFGRITGTGMNSDDYDEDNEVTVRGAIKNTVVLHHGAIAYDVAQRGTHGIMLPDNMTKEQLD
jgi:hypothetical protein